MPSNAPKSASQARRFAVQRQPSQTATPRRTFTCRQCNRGGFLSMDELSAHWEDDHARQLGRLRDTIAAQTAHKLPHLDTDSDPTDGE